MPPCLTPGRLSPRGRLCHRSVPRVPCVWLQEDARCRRGARTCLPAGFGSGWDNYRGEVGDTVARKAGAEGTSDAGRRRTAFLKAVQRQPAEACRCAPRMHAVDTEHSGSPPPLWTQPSPAML